MKNIFQAVSSSAIFAEIGENELKAMLNCLNATLKTFEKGETIFFEGDEVNEIGLVVSGRLHLTKSDVWGNNSIVTEITNPETFAEATVCAGINTISVSVAAKEKSEILFMGYGKVVGICSSACEFHSKLIRNMIAVLARKNIMMTEKMEHITKRSTREKLLSYLGEQSRTAKNKYFDIPYNRQELADYLSVERSALSAEMSRLKADGLIDYRKNHFRLFC